MKAIRLQNYGGSEQLKYEEVPIPSIADDQMLVRVYAVSVNHLDIKKASEPKGGFYGIELPWIPGCDFAGVVENPGKGDHGFAKGDKVYGNTKGGSYAEYLAVSPSTVVAKPDNLTYIEASSVPHVAETAWQAVHKYGKLKKGQKVLIHGAAGAVGAYAVQFARIVGADITASVAGQDADYVKSLGAGHIIDYQTTDFTKVAKDMDLVLVFVGGDTQIKSYGALKKGGILVSTTGPGDDALAKERNIEAIAMVIEQSSSDLKKISQLITDCLVKTNIAAVYSLPDAALAWKLLGNEDPSLPKVTHGKVVLDVYNGNE